MNNDEPILQKMEKDFGDWFNYGEPPRLTQDFYPYTNLFSQISIGNCDIKNRIVMGPISNQNMVCEKGLPTDYMIDFYKKRAKNGVGLIIVGNIQTAPEFDPTIEYDEKVNYPCLNAQKIGLQKWKELTDAVHVFGAKIFAELSCGQGRYGKAKVALAKFKLPLCASIVPNYYSQNVPCSRISDFALRKIAKKTAQTASYAIQAGFDGICLNGHSSGLIEQMSNKAFNKRNIGKFCKNDAFAVKIVQQIKQICGKNCIILYRANFSLAILSTYSDNIKIVKSFRNQRRILESFDFLRTLAETGVDAFDIGFGCYENWWLVCPPAYMPSGVYVNYVKLIKKYFEENKILSVNNRPIVFMSSGKLGYPDVAEKALIEKCVDMIVLARPLLADESWALKACAGDVENLRICIGCNQCLRSVLKGSYARCILNPKTTSVSNAKRTKRIAVIGAGPAGIAVSKILVERGHNVELYEACNMVGGSVNYYGSAKAKYDTKNYLLYLKNIIKKLQNCSNFALKTCQKAQIDDIKAKNYDCVVCANGAAYAGKNINGAVLPHVYTMFEAYANLSIFDNKKSVAIIGKLNYAIELAHMLACEKNIRVSILLDDNNYESLPKPNQDYLLHYLQKCNVKIYNFCKIVKIEEGYVDVLENIHKSVPNLFETWKFSHDCNNVKKQYRAVAVDADVVVLCEGTKPNDFFYQQACKQKIATEIYAIGDANNCGGLAGAIKQAIDLANEI